LVEAITFDARQYATCRKKPGIDGSSGMRLEGAALASPICCRLGVLLFLPLTSELLASIGWRATFAVTALPVLVVIGAFAAFVGNDPPASWSEYEAAPAPLAGVAPEEGICRFGTLQQIYRSPIFWLTAAGFSMFYFGQWAFLFHGPQVMQHGGLTTREAALALAATRGLGVIVRLSTGAVLARLVRIEFLAAGVLGVMAVARGILATGTSMVSLSLFVVLWGVGSGLGPALEPLLVSRFFARRHYASVYGALDGIETVVSFPGSPGSGESRTPWATRMCRPSGCMPRR